MASSEAESVLVGALRVFLASGFHTATIGELEQATGAAWSELRALYGDKEGLFLAAIEQRLLTLTAGAPDAREVEAVAELLRCVPAAGSSVMLRAQHREVLRRLTRLADAAAGR